MSSGRSRAEKRYREFSTAQSREKIQGVQDGAEQREDTGSSVHHRAERRFRASRTEQSREEIRGIHDSTEQREDRGSPGRSRAERRYWASRRGAEQRGDTEFRTDESRE